MRSQWWHLQNYMVDADYWCESPWITAFGWSGLNWPNSRLFQWAQKRGVGGGGGGYNWIWCLIAGMATEVCSVRTNRTETLHNWHNSNVVQVCLWFLPPPRGISYPIMAKMRSQNQDNAYRQEGQICITSTCDYQQLMILIFPPLCWHQKKIVVNCRWTIWQILHPQDSGSGQDIIISTTQKFLDAIMRE